MYKRYVKRIIDIILSFLGIIVLIIPMAIVAVIIKLDSPGPVFFTQKRAGKKGTYFNIIKFRSMPVTAPHDMPTHKLENARQLLSPWQSFMRKMSIDEIPQLFCILKGDMSIIGPRPALWNQEDLIKQRDKYGANSVTPGLTGLAQIKGRDELPIETKAYLDGEYANKISFIFDVKIFFGTILSVLKHDGVVEGAVSEEKKDVAKL